MAYEGEVLQQCPGRIYDFRRAYAVVVSGDKPNKWGHMLLNTGGPGGYYFQTAGLYQFPRVMNETQFRRYLSENEKYIITVTRIPIPHPEKSQLKLERALAGKWFWLRHDCESFVEEIVMAGGGPRLHVGLIALPIQSTNQCRPW